MATTSDIARTNAGVYLELQVLEFQVRSPSARPPSDFERNAKANIYLYTSLRLQGEHKVLKYKAIRVRVPDKHHHCTLLTHSTYRLLFADTSAPSSTSILIRRRQSRDKT
jgi:hypothetical protein